MTDQTKPGTDVAEVQQLSPELARQFADMATLVPTETGDATENILGAILNAANWDDLDQPWESSAVDALTGKVLKINSIVRRPSDFADGLGVFLVVRYTDTSSGELGVFTTSSLSVVAQLVRAYAAGWLPMYAEFIVAQRPTERGYRPHHLKIVGRDSEKVS